MLAICQITGFDTTELRAQNMFLNIKRKKKRKKMQASYNKHVTFCDLGPGRWQILNPWTEESKLINFICFNIRFYIYL